MGWNRVPVPRAYGERMASLKDAIADQAHLHAEAPQGRSSLPARWFRNRLIDSCTESPKAPSGAWRGFFRTLRYRMAGLGLPMTSNEKRLVALKDRHKGQRTFILGNGPSLNLCDLSLLRHEITFGVNAIYLNHEKMGFYPTYYVVEDEFIAEDRAAEINSLKGPQKFFGNYLNYCLADQRDVTWINLRMDYGPYPRFPNFSRNAARTVWVGGTVTYVCLQLAYYMGCREVYLVGFDHSYRIPADARIDGQAITSQSGDPNHFNAGYFGKGYRWHDPMVERMEQAFRRAQQVYAAGGPRIFNATVGGKLEVFDRVDYSSLF